MDCDFAQIRQEIIGLTQSELANKLGCSRAKVHRVENRKGYYTPIEVIKFAQLANLSVEALFKIKAKRSNAVPQKPVSKHQPKWFKEYQYLTKSKQNLIDETIEPLIKWLKK